MACPSCFAGHVHSGTPQGTVIDLHGYKTYITPAPSRTNSNNTDPSRAILYLPDFFSHRLVNNKLLADRYAAATGYTVYFPDIVRNGGVDPSWLPIFEPVMDQATPWWRKAYLYFWLLPLMPQMVLGGPDRALGEVDAVFTGHPSRLRAPEDFVSAVMGKVPMSVAVAEVDPMFDKAKAEEVEAVLRGRGVVSGKEGHVYEFKVYEGAAHGFCVRLKGGEDEETAAGAEKQAVEWFQKYLARESVWA